MSRAQTTGVIWMLAALIAMAIASSPHLGPDDITAEQDIHEAEALLIQAESESKRADREAAAFSRHTPKGTI